MVQAVASGCELLQVRRLIRKLQEFVASIGPVPNDLSCKKVGPSVNTPDIVRPRILSSKKTRLLLRFITARGTAIFFSKRNGTTSFWLDDLSLQDQSSFDTQVICWFPPGLSPR